MSSEADGDFLLKRGLSPRSFRSILGSDEFKVVYSGTYLCVPKRTSPHDFTDDDLWGELTFFVENLRHL